MKTSLKFASLAALTAATLALPVAAQQGKDTSSSTPKTNMNKCAASKCAATKCATKKPVHKCAAKCGAKCGAKCAPKCAPKK